MWKGVHSLLHSLQIFAEGPMPGTAQSPLRTSNIQDPCLHRTEIVIYKKSHKYNMSSDDKTCKETIEGAVRGGNLIRFGELVEDFHEEALFELRSEEPTRK